MNDVDTERQRRSLNRLAVPEKRFGLRLPRVFRPLRRLRVCCIRHRRRSLICRLAADAVPGPASRRPANGAAAEKAARLPLPPAAAVSSDRLAVPEKSFGLRLPRVFRPLRRLRVCCIRHRRRSLNRLAVPEKSFGLTLILRFFDRCGESCPPASATGSGGQLSHLHVAPQGRKRPLSVTGRASS